jgi:hypothetical protein
VDYILWIIWCGSFSDMHVIVCHEHNRRQQAASTFPFCPTAEQRIYTAIEVCSKSLSRDANPEVKCLAIRR